MNRRNSIVGKMKTPPINVEDFLHRNQHSLHPSESFLHFSASFPRRAKSAMALFSLLKEVDASKKHWAIQICVVRSYETSVRDNPTTINSLEYVFQDKEGTRIHASVRQNLIEHFKPLFKVGSLYSVRSFIVATHAYGPKTTDHKYRIYLQHYTQVFEFFDEGFSRNLYLFKPFEEICEMTESEENKLFDVIGEVVAKDNLRTKTVFGRDANLIDFVIQDEKSNRLQCTLWGELACHLSTHLEATTGEPVVVIIQFCRVKKYNGVMRICNAFDVTNMILGEEDPEIISFKNKLVIDKQTSSQRISQLPSSTIFTQDDELARGDITLRSIDQLVENGELGAFWVLATIVAVETDKEWYYLSCRQKECSKKVVPIGKRFYCERCNVYETSAIERYKLHVRVVDGTGNAAFLIWDRDAIKLLEKSVEDLKENLRNVGDDDGIPTEFEKIEERDVLFKVQVRDANVRRKSDVFSVTKCVIDENLITRYKALQVETQQEDGPTNFEISRLKEGKGSSWNDGMTTPVKSIIELSGANDADEGDSTKRNRDGDYSTNMNKKLRAVIKKEIE